MMLRWTRIPHTHVSPSTGSSTKMGLAVALSERKAQSYLGMLKSRNIALAPYQAVEHCGFWSTLPVFCSLEESSPCFLPARWLCTPNKCLQQGAEQAAPKMVAMKHSFASKFRGEKPNTSLPSLRCANLALFLSLRVNKKGALWRH